MCDVTSLRLNYTLSLVLRDLGHHLMQFHQKPYWAWFFKICLKEDVIDVYLMRSLSPGQKTNDSIKISGQWETTVMNTVVRQILAATSEPMLPVTKLPESTERKHMVAPHSLMEEYFQRGVWSIAAPETNMSHRFILYSVPLRLVVSLQVSFAEGLFSSAGGSITIWYPMELEFHYQ